MDTKLMILPARNSKAIRLVRIPADFEAQEVFRRVVGLISEVEEQTPDHNWDDIAGILEDNGFELIDFILGPELS